MVAFPEQSPGVFYLTEGGQETEAQYRHGHQLPEFAMYPLLDNPAAMADLAAMYTAVLDVAANNGWNAMISGLDYRASPDWGARLGYSPDQLADAIIRNVQFLRDVAAPFADRIGHIMIGGQIGPRGDAYALNHTITAAEAEDYHAFQLQVLKRAQVDFVWAATFNSIPEAIGVALAASRVGLPLGLSFMLGSDYRLKSGDTLRQAIEAVDAATADARPAYYGINCSHPLEFEPALVDSDWMRRVRSLRPNASAKDKIELCSIGHLEEGDPADLGQRMAAIATRFPHVDIFGGCCGTWDKHLEAIARSVKAARA